MNHRNNTALAVDEEKESESPLKSRQGASSRFRKGRSGNPKGRPKDRKNLSAIVREALAVKVSVSVGGQNKRISKAEALVQLNLNQAIKGDSKALDAILWLAQQADGLIPAEAEHQGGMLVVPGVSKSTEEWERVHGPAARGELHSGGDEQRPKVTAPFTLASGDALRDAGKLDEALACYRRGLKYAQSALAREPGNPETHSEFSDLIKAIGAMAHYYVIDRQFAKGLECADQAVDLVTEPPRTPRGRAWLLTFHLFRANALMFLGRTDEARAVYVRHCGERFQCGSRQRTFETIVLQLFDALRRSGLSHPLMDEIERIFAND